MHFAALPPLLFDLKKDPGEMSNLADDPAYARRSCCDYAQKMLSWRMRHVERTLTHIHLKEGGPVIRPRQTWGAKAAE